MLTQCPRKFYLRNVCKIEEDDLNFFDIEFIDSELDKTNEYIEEGEFVSSANRGTTLHSAMEYAVKIILYYHSRKLWERNCLKKILLD